MPRVSRLAFTNLLLITSFGLAVHLRVLIGGAGVAHSKIAGISFGACLIAACVVKPPKLRFARRDILVGLLGLVILILPVFLRQILDPDIHRPAGNFVTWALVVSFVAISEELFLRGTLFDLIEKAHSNMAAVLITAALFAALHIPLYGWKVVGLDLMVGILFGWQRNLTNSVTAPALTHTLADLLSWWLR